MGIGLRQNEIPLVFQVAPGCVQFTHSVKRKKEEEKLENLLE
jgi:hypothetical protein